jgi:O-antigen/teichoic acid export membrane protein
MRTYGFYIMVAGLAGALNEVLGRNLLPRLWPAEGEWHGLRMNGWELNGIYSAMYKLGMFVALATQAFRYAAEPYFFRSARDKDSPRQFARIFHYYTLATLVMLLLIGVFRQELVSFGWGGWHLIAPDYWVGLEAVPHILLANVLLGAYLNLSIWFKLTKQVRFALIFTGGGALVTVVLNVGFISTYGYMASAWAAVACYGSMVVACYVLGQKYFPIPYQMGRPLLYLALAWLAIRVCDWAAPTLPVPFIATAAKAVLCAALLTLLVVWERNSPPEWPLAAGVAKSTT